MGENGNWRTQQGSNLWPLASETNALSNWAMGADFFWWVEDPPYETADFIKKSFNIQKNTPWKHSKTACVYRIIAILYFL